MGEAGREVGLYGLRWVGRILSELLSSEMMTNEAAEYLRKAIRQINEAYEIIRRQP